MAIMNDDDESTRETLKPWSDRWKNKRIGFHLPDVNPLLVQYSSVLFETTDDDDDDACEATQTTQQQTQPPTRIFVPLCGKAVDMAYLATTSTTSNPPAHVVGLDGIRVALEEFIAEHPSLTISTEALPPSDGLPFERFEGPTVSLWKGDYFDLSETTTTTALDAIGTFDAIYDRASIVAIEPKLRSEYVAILDQLLRPNGRILLVALERIAKKETPSAAAQGPPYSVPASTVRELFSGTGNGRYTVELLHETDLLVEKPEDRNRVPDLDKLLEAVYVIRKHATTTATPPENDS